MAELDDIVREFLIESSQGLEQAERDFLVLENDPKDAATVARLFRAVHTVKGTAGCLGFSRLERLTHAGETLLARYRDGALDAERSGIETLLAMVDAVRSSLGAIERAGEEPEGEHAALIERLLQHAANERPPPAVDVAFAAGQVPGVTENVVRVSVELLDHLVNLVGELVLARNQMLARGAQDDPALARLSQRLNLVTSALQDGVMKARMQPIANLFGRFPRMVRDVAAACKKRVRLDFEGGQTELDRSLIEAIKDPLTHLLRNAVDHGIEDAPTRAERGKPAEGRILVRAYHEGGQVIVEITDDGGGIDLSKIRIRAQERGLLDAEGILNVTERALLELIFMPGFSTADEVSTVSGRGVGMDVVRSQVTEIGGSVEVETRRGTGTTFKIQVPLTLAIVPAVLVFAGGMTFALPRVGVLEMIRLGQEGRIVEYVHDAPVLRLRGALLPLVELCDLLSLPAREPGTPGSVVVLETGGVRFGLVVGGILDAVEIVVKAIDAALKSIGVYSGATILGDGAVALILDVPAVAKRAGLSLEAAVPKSPEGAAPSTKLPEQLLVVSAGGARFAIGLGDVVRLERIPRAALETTREGFVTQRLGGVLRLAWFSDLVSMPRATDAGETVNVVVCRTTRGSVGVLVDRIVDTVQAPLEVAVGVPASPVSQLVLDGRVTEIVKLSAVLEDRGARNVERRLAS